MSLRRLASSCLVAALVLTATPCLAEGDAFASGLKFGLEVSVGQLAGMGYKINCKAKNLDYKSDDSWYCGVFAKLSKQDEAEHKERVLHNLAKIRTQLDNLAKGISAIQEGQEQIYEQNKQILLRLDELGPETTIGKELSHIRTLYNEQYVPLFNGERAFTADRLRAFANRIIFTDKIHDRLGVIDDQLTVPQRAGQEPLLRAYATRAWEQVRAKNGASVEPAYVYLEAIVDGLLAEQRKGYLMYVWATETLQSDCEVAEAEVAAATTAEAKSKAEGEAAVRCKAFREFPHTADEYRVTFGRHVRGQLSELNAGLEYQVLAASDTHARRPNFLHSEGEGLFRRADFFTAANLGEFGVRGRIISMGDAFNGTATIAGASRKPEGDPHKVKTYGGRVDWWTSTTKDLSYDELHFGDRWSVYSYALPTVGPGKYTIDTTLPYRSLIEVKNVTIGNESVKDAQSGGQAAQKTVPFGSFTAIDRAGGGYALLSGEYFANLVKSIDTVVGDFKGGWDKMEFDDQNMRAGVMFSGDLEWKSKNLPNDQYISAERSMFAVSKKGIRYPAGGDLTFRVDFGDTLPTVCPGGGCAEFYPNAVMRRLLDLSKPTFGGRSAELAVRSAVLLDTSENGSNGFVWERGGTTDTKFDDWEEASQKTKKVRLDATPRNFIFGGRLKMNAQTSSTSNTRWWAYALTYLENAYVTE